MTDTIYQAAIIGLGFIGGADQVSGDNVGQKVSNLDGTHSVALSNHPCVDLVAGSSRDLGRRERFARRTEARTYSDWRELLAQEELDIVSVATYTPSHAEISIACAEHGVRVIYCEKAIATRLSDAERMLEVCRENGALLVINHNARFSPNCRRLRDLILANQLGELTSASVQWSTGRLGGVGTHVIDALCMLTSRRVLAVSGTLDLSGRPDCRGPKFRDPGAWGVIQLENGLMVTVNAPDYGNVPLQICINGTAGRAITDRSQVTIDYENDNEQQWPPSNDGKTSMDRAVGEIVAWLNDGTPFPYAADEAAGTLEAVVGFHVSHARNAAWVELPLLGVDRDREVLSA